MGLIARTGGIAYTDPLVLAITGEDVELFYRNPQGPPFSWSRFMGFDLESPATGRVYPLFFHLFPAFGAYLFQAMGVKGALATPSVFGILGTLGFFLALRRSLGDAPALLGGTLLALNPLQVWFGRYPVSEGMSQFLVALGLLAFTHWEERGSRSFGVLAGFALGLSLLVRIDRLLVLVPLTLYFALRWAGGDLPMRRAASVLLPLGLLLECGGELKRLYNVAPAVQYHAPDSASHDTRFKNEVGSGRFRRFDALRKDAKKRARRGQLSSYEKAPETI